jgi:hypothetical protein
MTAINQAALLSLPQSHPITVQDYITGSRKVLKPTIDNKELIKQILVYRAVLVAARKQGSKVVLLYNFIEI